MAVQEFEGKLKEIFTKAADQLPEVRTWRKVYQFVLEDGGEFYIEISEGQIKVVEGRHPSPIATLTTTSEVLNRILNGEEDAMKAFMAKRLKITGNVLDTVNLKKLIDAGLGKEV